MISLLTKIIHQSILLGGTNSIKNFRNLQILEKVVIIQIEANKVQANLLDVNNLVTNSIKQQISTNMKKVLLKLNRKLDNK